MFNICEDNTYVETHQKTQDESNCQRFSTYKSAQEYPTIMENHQTYTLLHSKVKDLPKEKLGSNAIMPDS